MLESTIFSLLERRVVNTSFGDVVLHFSKDFIFCQRHQADPSKEYTQPHLINTRVRKLFVNHLCSFYADFTIVITLLNDWFHILEIKTD